MKPYLLLTLVACGAPARPVTPVADAPQPERMGPLPPEEIAEITRELQQALPPVNPEASAVCTAMVDEANRDPEKGGHALGEAAACLRAAGAVGGAIQIWKALAQSHAEADWGRTAQRELGPAYELIGLFAQAAEAYEAYARAVPSERGRLARAACLWRQLGEEARAVAAERELGPSPSCSSIRLLRPAKRS